MLGAKDTGLAIFSPSGWLLLVVVFVVGGVGLLDGCWLLIS